MKLLIFLLPVVLAAPAQLQQPHTTPVPILKQINRHNEDGSYSYGYEAADGSFKIESKYPTGEVYGKYGYIDDQGQLREVEYGATSGRGFEPAGTGIKVPPPTVNTKNEYYPPLKPGEEDDGQYREDPSIYYKDSRYNSDVSNSLQQQQPQPQYIQPQPKPSAAPSYAVPQRKNFYFINNASPAPVSEEPKEDYYQPKSQPQQQYYQPQQQYYQPQQQQYQEPEPQYYQQRASQQYYQPRQPVVVDMNQFRGHPASNFDLNTGSYSVNYSG